MRMGEIERRYRVEVPALPGKQTFKVRVGDGFIHPQADKVLITGDGGLHFATNGVVILKLPRGTWADISLEATNG